MKVSNFFRKKLLNDTYLVKHGALKTSANTLVFAGHKYSLISAAVTFIRASL